MQRRLSMFFHKLSDGQTLRVLVAEDDDIVRDFIVSSLRLDGHEVVEARDARELVARTGPDPEGASSYDVVVSDVLMPGANGISVLARVAQYKAPPPIVMMSSFADADLRDWARSIGAIATFAKPFDIDDLRTLLWNIPSRARRSKPCSEAR